MCVSSLAGVKYLRYTALTSPKKGETAVHCCDPTLSVHVMLVSRNVFHVVSALQSILSLHNFILADRISCRSYICSVYRMRSFAVCHSFNLRVCQPMLNHNQNLFLIVSYCSARLASLQKFLKDKCDACE